MKIFKKIVKVILLKFISLLPSLRCNNVKRIIYNFLGYNISEEVIISSSFKIMGNIKVEIGSHTFMGHETTIIGGDSEVIIGSYCDISSMVKIVSGTHELDMIGNRTAGKGIGKDIIIEDGVWIGFGALILPGVRIGKKAVIGAGSVVTRDIPSYSIAVGNPCKVIKSFELQ